MQRDLDKQVWHSSACHMNCDTAIGVESFHLTDLNTEWLFKECQVGCNGRN